MRETDMPRLVEEAGFIFRGRVVRHGTTDANLMTAAAGKIVTVEIEEIFLSADGLSGLVGKEAIVVTENAAEIQEGATRVFFTNIVSLANHLVVREVGHIEASHATVRATENSVRTAAERPLLQRVAGASLIITGRVISRRPVDPNAIRKSEHDPDWWIARVEVLSVVKGGKAGSAVDVLFANSRDIAWYKSPKLEEEARGILLLRRVNEDEVPQEVARRSYQAIEPLDFLPLERLPDVERALDQYRGGS
ncbi:MAG: hypothetical protein JWL77_4531 [Chthonomonadaceae bacterium]|nr:hypothetical protein [Chthonomonadaceae bacterium]